MNKKIFLALGIFALLLVPLAYAQNELEEGELVITDITEISFFDKVMNLFSSPFALVPSKRTYFAGETVTMRADGTSWNVKCNSATVVVEVYDQNDNFVETVNDYFGSVDGNARYNARVSYRLSILGGAGTWRAASYLWCNDGDWKTKNPELSSKTISTAYKTTWTVKIKEEEECDSGYTGYKQCDGNGDVVQTYRSRDCEEVWKVRDDCSSNEYCKNAKCYVNDDPDPVPPCPNMPPKPCNFAFLVESTCTWNDAGCPKSDPDPDPVVCSSSKEETDKPCESADWIETPPDCYWDNANCGGEDSDGCITKPEPQCEASVWNADPYCQWDNRPCQSSEVCPVPPSEDNEPCDDAIWVDYPTCVWNTVQCGDIEKDSDLDGLPDTVDECPYSFAKTYNGCPSAINRSKYYYIFGAIGAGLVIIFLLFKRGKKR